MMKSLTAAVAAAVLVGFTGGAIAADKVKAKPAAAKKAAPKKVAKGKSCGTMMYKDKKTKKCVSAADKKG